MAAGNVEGLWAGQILIATSGEYLQMMGITDSSVAISSALGSISATTIEANDSIDVVSDVALEGVDVEVDISF